LFVIDLRSFSTVRGQNGKRAEEQAHPAAQSLLVSLRQRSVRRLGILGITAQFLALIRILSEVFRIRYFDASHYTLLGLEPFIGAALFTAVMVALAVAMFVLERERVAVTIALFNIVALFVYKVSFM